MICTLINFIHRHGERNPTLLEFVPWQKFDKAINLLIKKSNGVSPSLDIKFPWRNLFRIEERGQMVPVGDKTVYEIGRRYAKRFPELLRHRFSSSEYKFVSSYKPRASRTAMAFSLGYLKGKGHVTKLRLQPVPITTLPFANDTLLLFSENCPKWTRDVKGNPLTLLEFAKFSKLPSKSSKINRFVRRVRKMLGLENVKEVNVELLTDRHVLLLWL